MAEHQLASQRGRAAGSPWKEMAMRFVDAPSAIVSATAFGASEALASSMATTFLKSKWPRVVVRLSFS